MFDPNRAITLADLTRTDLENFYWFIDESLNYDTPANRDKMYHWKSKVGDKYSDMFGTDKTCSLVFKGEDRDILMGAVKLNLQYVRNPRTDMATKIKERML